MTTSYTADALLEEVRRLGSFSATAATGLADADILAHADSELRDTLVPLMLGVSEELYQRVFSHTVTRGTAAYRINKRAAISRINTVQWVNSDGSTINLSRLEPKQVAEISTVTAQGRPWAYYLEGSRVVLFPTPTDSTATLRIRAMARPSRLTLTTDSTNLKTISAVSLGTSTLPNDTWFLTIVAHGIISNTVRDVVCATPSFEHLVLDGALTVEDADGVSIPSASFSSAPAAGDYLCISDYTPVIQLPVELHPALFELTASRVLRALGKSQESADHANEAQRLVATGIQALTPRVDTADRKVVGGPHWRRRGYIGLLGGR